MKLISWNVNGLRSCIAKGFYDFIIEEDADFICIQETKMQEGQEIIKINGYHQYWNSAVRKGYSGTLIFAKEEPLKVILGLHGGKYNDEGRVITLEYSDFYLITSYSPNSQEELKRLNYRLQFEDDFYDYLAALKKQKNVIVCGDLNVAHEEIDIKNPKSNIKSAGFTIEERTKFSRLLASGFKDTFRYLYPLSVKYSWWSYRFRARENNAGWRIDYFLVNDGLVSQVVDSVIYNDIFGSDHCPVGLILK